MCGAFFVGSLLVLLGWFFFFCLGGFCVGFFACPCWQRDASATYNENKLKNILNNGVFHLVYLNCMEILYKISNVCKVFCCPLLVERLYCKQSARLVHSFYLYISKGNIFQKICIYFYKNKMLTTELCHIYLMMRTFLFEFCVYESVCLAAFYLYLSRQPIQFDSVGCWLKYFFALD